MAKTKLSSLLVSLESEDGVAHPVDVKETGASLDKPDLKTSEDDGSSKGQIQAAHQEVDAGMKDYTAVDEASKKQGEAIAKQLERLQEATASTEAYLELLKGNRRQGLDSGTASVMAHDFKQMYPKFFSKAIASLEAIDDEASDQKRLVSTKDVEKETTGKLGKLKSAVKEAWAKFWEWVKSIYAKIKKFITKLFGGVEAETEKTVYLLSVAKVIPEKGGSIKNLPKPPSGVKSKAAEKIQLLIGHEKKDTPAKELPKTIRIAGSSILESVEDDLWGMGSRETGGLTHIYDYYTNMMWRAGNHLKSEVITKAEADAFEKDIATLAKFPTTAIFAGNKKFEYLEGTASLKLVDAGKGGKSFEEIEMLSKSDIKNYLEKNKTLLGNIKWIGESWEKTLVMLSDLDIKDAESPEIKNIITKRIREFLNSDIDAFFKLCTDVAMKRNQLLDHMLMIHAECSGSDK